jgi:hypothetical protein
LGGDLLGPDALGDEPAESRASARERAIKQKIKRLTETADNAAILVNEIWILLSVWGTILVDKMRILDQVGLRSQRWAPRIDGIRTAAEDIHR